MTMLTLTDERSSVYTYMCLCVWRFCTCIGFLSARVPPCVDIDHLVGDLLRCAGRRGVPFNHHEFSSSYRYVRDTIWHCIKYESQRILVCTCGYVLIDVAFVSFRFRARDHISDVCVLPPRGADQGRRRGQDEWQGACLRGTIPPIKHVIHDVIMMSHEDVFACDSSSRSLN